MGRRDPEARYNDKLRKQQVALEEFAAHEIEFADDLLYWYRVKKQDIPDTVYRGVVYFLNREFHKKPGSLTLLYNLNNQLMKELPEYTKELAFALLSYRYRKYGLALNEGGF